MKRVDDRIVLFKKEKETTDILWEEHPDWRMGYDLFVYIPTSKYYEKIYEDSEIVELREMNTLL